jgi:hypothetical protein
VSQKAVAWVTANSLGKSETKMSPEALTSHPPVPPRRTAAECFVRRVWEENLPAPSSGYCSSFRFFPTSGPPAVILLRTYCNVPFTGGVGSADEAFTALFVDF